MSLVDIFPRSYFTRYDESADRTFYLRPRLTVHIDGGARAALSTFLLQRLPPAATLLDLMSSYRSHLPRQLPLARVVGLGLNAEEMARNQQLNDFVVHDLNDDPQLPFAPVSFDGAICTVSVQYLTRPVEVFADVARTLRPGAPFIVSFSNRCFPSKAVHIWLNSSNEQRLHLVQMYFACAGCFASIEGHDLSPRRLWGDRLFVVCGQRTPDGA